MSNPNKFCSIVVFIVMLFSFYNNADAQAPDSVLAVQYMHLADSLKSRGQSQSAIVVIEKALDLYKRQEDWGQWLYAQNKLASSYRRMGAYVKGISKIDEALAEVEGKVVADDFRYYQLKLTKGSLIFKKGDFDQAIQLVDNLLPEIQQKRLESSPLLYQAYSHLSIYHEAVLAFEKALDYGMKALDMAKKRYDAQSNELATALHRVGNNLIHFKEFEKALEYHKEGVNIRLGIYKDEKHPRLIQGYTNVGICYGGMEDYSTAETYFLKALEIGQNTYGEIHPWTSGFLWNLGTFYNKQNKLTEALAYFQRELNIRKKLHHNQRNLAENYDRIGRVYRKLNRTEEALESYNHALSLISDHFSPTDLYDAPMADQILLKSFSLKYIQDKIGAFNDYLQQHPLDEKALKAGIALGDLSLSIWQSLSYQWGIQKNTKQINSLSVRNSVQYASLMAWQMHQKTGEVAYAKTAWRLAEQGKSMLLREAYLQAEAETVVGLSKELAVEEKQLSEELAVYESELLSAIRRKDSLQINHLRNDQIFNTKIRYEKLVRRLEQENPDYFDLKYNSLTTSVSDIQSFLDDDQLFVEYLVHPVTRQLLIFAIEKDKPLHIQHQNLPKDILESSAEFKQLLQSYSLFRKRKKERFVEISHSLYQLLIKPLEKNLEGKQKIVIVGEGFANSIPFEVLLPNDNVGDFSSMNFLIRQFEISYHYSGTLFTLRQQTQKDFDGDLLAFAPVFESDNAVIGNDRFTELTQDTSLRSIDGNGSFKKLPHTEAEVKGIAALYQQQPEHNKLRVLLKEQATEQALKEELKQTYRVVHLASHSFSNLRLPEMSGIACTPSGETASEDGILFSGEIYNMRVDCDLLVLSSCESGIGKVIEGEGMLGLNRSFVHAGAPNVVFSLWKVYDQITNEMMQSFYTNVLAGASYAKALQNAKCQLLKDEKTASPHYWSAFLLIGR